MSRFVKTKKRLTNLSLVWSIRIIRIFSRIAPYRLGVWFGGLLGFAGYYLLPRDRNRALSHLRSVFSERDEIWIRRTARRNFHHLGKSLLEVMLLTPRMLGRIVDFRGYENIQEAIQQGRGAVYVTGHIGNWEIMAAAVAERFPLSVIAAPIDPQHLNDTIVKLRADKGVKTILRSRPGASRELIRVFRENRIIGILIDQDTDVDGAFVDFMGRPAWTPTAAAQMAIKFGAPVVFGYIQRNGSRHTINVEGPLHLIRTGDNDKDVIANTAMLTKKIEDCVLKNPDQWVWMHRRWRRQP